MNMKLSLSTFLIIIFIVFFSIFIANLSNIIAIHLENNVSVNRENSTKAFGEVRKKHKIMGESSENLMWFMQISDLHISIFHEQTRIEQLREFCSDVVSTIGPAVVLATGDLTDAKTADNMGSAQQLREWQIYRKILSDTHVTNKTVWLDIRGNHDNFNIPDEKSDLNYYRSFSIQGLRNPHSYIHITDINGDRYGFLGIDACLSPGPKRPFNFIGVLNGNETRNIDSLIRLARGSNVDYTITFGHYPTSCILSESPGNLRRQLVEAPGGWVYLCGHFHMLGGLVPNMYTLQQTGLLELELADWKENRLLAAMDHGMFSFVDVEHADWPVILVTNPKHALYMVPGRESPLDISSSTHIRLLVFSPYPIELVQVSVDDGEWLTATKVPDHPALYIASWNPSIFKDGIHTLHVRARDSSTRERGMSQPFSLDGSRLPFGFWPRVALMSNISTLFQCLFGLSVCLAVVPLCIFRILHSMVLRGRIARPQIRSRTLRRWTRQLWILSSIDKTFFPIVIYPLYLSIGPWAIGEIIDGQIGAIFAWGMIVNDSYLPGSFTYAYGFLHMVSFQLPLTLILAHDVERRFRQCERYGGVVFGGTYYHHIPFMVIMVIQCIGAYFFWLAYGTLAFFLGPLRTWSIIFGMALWYYVQKLQKFNFREVSPIWESKTFNRECAHDFNE